MGKNNGILIVIGLMVVVVGAVLLFPTDTKEKDFMEVQFYDSDGNKIYDTNTLATVGVGSQTFNNVASLKFVVNVANVGDTPVTISWVSVSPTQLSSAFTQTSQTLNAKGNTYSWTSALIDANQFAPTTGSSPVTFSVTMRGVYGTSYSADKTATITMTFTKDATTGYTVSLNETQGTGSGVGGTGSNTYPGPTCNANSISDVPSGTTAVYCPEYAQSGSNYLMFCDLNNVYTKGKVCYVGCGSVSTSNGITCPTGTTCQTNTINSNYRICR